jgi:ankyrin repeat protein
MTRLMNAIRKNDLPTVRQLVQSGEDVNLLDEVGDAPLIIAAYEGFTEIVRLLLEAGADVTVVDPGMQATALHAAAYAGRTEAARLLIEHGIDIDKQGPHNGYTALHDAIWQNNVETARVILLARPNLTLKNHAGQTPLEMARSRGRKEIATLIEASMS